MCMMIARRIKLLFFFSAYSSSKNIWGCLLENSISSIFNGFIDFKSIHTRVLQDWHYIFCIWNCHVGDCRLEKTYFLWRLWSFNTFQDQWWLGCLNNHCYHGYLYHFIGFALEPLDLHKKKKKKSKYLDWPPPVIFSHTYYPKMDRFFFCFVFWQVL